MTTLIRQDAFDYKFYDMGCKVNPVMLGCLSCPLPVCKYDDPGGRRRDEARAKREESRRLYAEHVPVVQIAACLKVSTRNVYRNVQGLRP